MSEIILRERNDVSMTKNNFNLVKDFETIVIEDLENNDAEDSGIVADLEDEELDFLENSHILDVCEAPRVGGIFLGLPDEVWLKVFSFMCQGELCVISLVSKHFLRLSRDPSLWLSLVLIGDALSDTERVQSLVKRCTFLVEFSIQARDDADVLIQCLCDFCPQLKKLEIKFCQSVLPFQLQQLTENCPKVEAINLEGTGCLNDDGDSHEMEGSNRCLCNPEDSFSIILGRFTNLTDLNLFLCKNLNSKGLEQIAKHCLVLESLNIDEVNYLNDDSMITLIKERQNTLKKLWIDGESFTDNSFSQMGKLKKLELLSISFADSMKSEGLAGISQLANLDWLRIRRGAELLSSDFVTAFDGGKLKKLTTLDLSECSNLHDSGLISVASNCPDLVYLSLCWCWELTDESVCAIVNKCRRLVAINLCGVVRLAGAFLHNINKKLKELEVIDLEQVPDIDQDLVEDLVRQDLDLVIKDYYGENVRPGRIFSEILLDRPDIKFITFDHEDSQSDDNDL